MSNSFAGLEGRLAQIDAFYANTLNTVTIRLGTISHLLPGNSLRQASQRLVEESQGTLNKAWLNSQPTGFAELAGQALFKGIRSGGAQTSLQDSTFQRSLVNMPEPERASLRLADILRAIGRLSDDDYYRAIVPIIWNGGNTLITIGGRHGNNFRGSNAANQILKDLIGSTFGDSAAGRERVQAALRGILENKTELAGTVRAVLERYLFAGARWISEAEASTAAVRQTDSPSALRLGTIPGTSKDLLYDWNESLITVAAPGTGKSQAHVLRNLLYLKAPAVALDIKGEMREASATWRSEHVGPVFTFDPQRPDESLHYNPLDCVSADPEQGWDEARRLADLLVVPPSSSSRDQYWESRGRDLITTAVFHVALTEKGAHRSMSGVLDRLYVPPGEKLNEWFDDLDALDVPQLRRQANALRGLPVEQREGIFDSARRQLEIWQSPAINRLSASTTFSAEMLRESNATLYLCVSLDDVKKFASILRVIVGQTLHVLFRVKPESGALPVTFFLDEMARLGHMDVIEQALDMGRGYGVRLWLFCQNSGQLSSAYRNADGMTGNCAARCYMNPDEDTARWISQNLGTREGLLDGHRKPLADPSQLTGPEFANRLIVFLRGHPPAQLEKSPAYSDPICQKRMAGESEPEASVGPLPTTPPSVLQPASPSEPDASVHTVSAAPEAVPITAAPTARDAELVASTPAAPSPKAITIPAIDLRRWAIPVAATVAAVAWSVMAYVQLESARAGETAALKARDNMRAEVQRAESAARSANSRLTSEQSRLTTEVSALKGQLTQAQTTIEAHRLDALRARQELASLNASIAERNRFASLPSAPVQTPAPSPSLSFPAQTPFSPQSTSPTRDQVNPAQLNDRNTCDQLAGNKYDPNWPRQFEGASFGELRANAAQAISACERAANAAPDEPRMKYQLARALQAANQSDRAFELLSPLANSGYPAAFDNLGFHYMRLQQVGTAINYHRRGADAGDPEAMVTVAELIEQNKARSRYQNEFWDLLQRAAQLGHEGARKTLSEKSRVGEIIQQIPDRIRDWINRR